MKKLVIFDMDGLLFDTERINYEAWMSVSKKYGFDFDEPLHTSFIGIRESEIETYFAEMYGPESDMASWVKEVRQTQEDYIDTHQTVHPKAGLFELLDYLDEKGIKKVVASSSSIEVIEKYLGMEGIRNRFDFVVSGEQVEHGKPAPDVFLLACQKANIEPKDAMVLEDSKNGLKAAVAAAITAVFIPDRIGRTEEMLSLSDVVVGDLAEVISLLEQEEVE